MSIHDTDAETIEAFTKFVVYMSELSYQHNADGKHDQCNAAWSAATKAGFAIFGQDGEDIAEEIMKGHSSEPVSYWLKVVNQIIAERAAELQYQ